MMNYFDTYEEAKSAYPDCDVVMTTGSKWHLHQALEEQGSFAPAYSTDRLPFKTEFKWTWCEEVGKSYPIIDDTAWVVATPPKPTRTVYEKAEFNHAWEAVKAFEEGEEFYFMRGSGEYEQAYIDEAFALFVNENLYRKAVKELDWREEVKDFVESSETIPYDTTIESFYESTDISEGKFRDEFLEMCRVALRANGEL